MIYDPLYLQFLYHFNIDRDYFECHEVMEELWLEEGRSPLYQGLLQVAVGLYHARNDNFSGAVKLLTQAVNKLELYPNHQLGIDLDKLLVDCHAYLKGLTDDTVAFDFYDIDILILDPQLEEAAKQMEGRSE
jgi:predicted metal-dependent hydrolase